MDKFRIIKRYLSSKGYTFISNENISNDGLAPFLVADLAYNTFYCNRVKNIPLKHYFKQCKNRFEKAYNAFNKELFRALSDDMIEEIINKMDELDDSLHNDIELLRIAVMDKMMDVDYQVRVDISDMVILLHLSRSAQYIWECIYVFRQKEGHVNKDLQAMTHYACEMFSEYCRQMLPSGKIVSLYEFEDIKDRSKRVCDQMLKFTKTWK